MPLVKVAYVGLLDVFEDHLYDSGTWKKGVPREVEDFKAAKLLKHTEFVDARAPSQQKPVKAVEPERPEEPPEIDELPPLTSLDTMTKDQLVSFAKRQFNVELPTSINKAEMIDRVRRQMGRK